MSEHFHFTGIEVWRAHFPFRLAFSHNLASRRGTETLIIVLHDSLGRTGYGQVLPRSYLTGETIEGAEEDIRSRWWPELARLSIPTMRAEEHLSTALGQVFTQADALRITASYAGVDVAAHMILGGASSPETFPLVGVISAAAPVKAAWIARVMRWLGYRRFKVKVGGNAAVDEARLAVVRRVIGADAWLAVDANAAWTWDEAVDRIRGLAAFQVAVVEEPLVAGVAATADFSRLEELGGIATMADESLCSLADARALLERGTPAWWNIRLAKNGGVTGVRRVAALAREKGVKVYGGILVGETGALAAAGRYVFPAVGAECGEYGFSRVFLRGDPFRGSPAGYRGHFTGGYEWGGVTLSDDTLHRRATLVYRLQR